MTPDTGRRLNVILKAKPRCVDFDTKPSTKEEVSHCLHDLPVRQIDSLANGLLGLGNLVPQNRLCYLKGVGHRSVACAAELFVSRKGQHPTIVISSTQKNRRNEEVPMLPGLHELLNSVPKKLRIGWVVKLASVDPESRSFRPVESDLTKLVRHHSNVQIAVACGVSNAAVAKWMKFHGFVRENRIVGACNVSESKVREMKIRAIMDCDSRFSPEYVGGIISKIGEEAKVIVSSKPRLKYASAHDLRRSCAERLINSGVSAEALKVIFRHSSFATTEKHYGASRSAQMAANEVLDKLSSVDSQELVGGMKKLLS